MKETVVIAFGGNAMLPRGQGTMAEQRRNIAAVCQSLAEIAEQGHKLVVTHGNGPQVGEILLMSERSGTDGGLPLDVVGAMSQGQIGYLLQQELSNALLRVCPARSACTILTQVVVDPSDPAFTRPSKPIGRFYRRSEIAGMAAAGGWAVEEDAGRGFRRVVASPEPQSIVEGQCIRTLLEVGVVVIAAGGGGIPVVRDDVGILRGVEAVIDKDLAAWRLAGLLGADTLIFLTAVEAVAVGFGTREERPLERSSPEELQHWLDAGEFPEGSMGPKVLVALRFLRDGGRRAIITSPDRLSRAVEGSAGTQILRDLSAPEMPVGGSRKGAR